MVSHVVLERTALLYGRHLDQALLCALYGVCKVRAAGPVACACPCWALPRQHPVADSIRVLCRVLRV